MVFTAPKWVGELPYDVPTNTLVGDFVFTKAWPRLSDAVPNGKLVCAISGNSITLQEIRERVDLLARSLSHRLNWKPEEGAPWQKVIGVFSLNAVDFLTACWAIHRVGGICLLLHPTSPASEIEAHMKRSNCHAVFTNYALLPTCLEATNGVGILADNVFILEIPGIPKPDDGPGASLHTVEALIAEGSSLSTINPVNWDDEEGTERVAYLCPTSGTSGMQKLAIVTHRGFIANMMQGRTFEDAGEEGGVPQVGLGILPLTHSYGLTVAQAMLWRNDTLILHPRFEMQAMLKSIMQYKIDRLYLIPPILAALANNTFLLDLCDLSSVKSIVTGAGGLSKELSDKIRSLRPSWTMLSGYGLTECAVMVALTSNRSLLPGSSGILLPQYKARLVDLEGRDIEGYDKAGELLLQTPSLMKGYVGDEVASKASFESAGWLRTGDVGLFRPGTDGSEHLFIVDRLKDMIQVKGIQVVPTEIEACLQLHPDVADAAVVAVKDPRDGERAKAFIIRSATGVGKDEGELKKVIAKHVEERLTEPHWLHRRVEFVDQFPRSQAGKVLKYQLRLMSA
ncbi:amp-dependent ligase [Trichoderma arundinaceum]|uniref:Amp-dependent ligase n=1 Tax=Trichoderma arundinaceum TaxID=490622 RepID=A0A395NUD8_TRIAR|nr:amp-dependent ligase [Trichoderma arundinaceum]